MAAPQIECNWIQVLDAIMDPVHTSFLHGQSSGLQFSKGFAEVGELEFIERGIQYLGCNTRRVDDYVWVRVNELILPNFTQAGSAFAADGTKTRYFGRSSFTRWVVPIDDNHCVALAWGNFGERGDPIKYNNKEGCERIEAGEIMDRTWKEKQKRPGDAEAVEGMGSISSHKGEHLMPTDYGVMIYRRRIKKLIRSIGSKTEITESGQKVVDTYRKDNKPEEVSKYNLLKEKSHSFNEDYVLEDTIESRIKILKIISTNDGLMSQKDLFKHLPGEFTEKIHFLDLLATEKLIEILIIDHFENVKITEKGIKYLNSVNLDKPGLYTPYGTTQTFKVSEKSQDELPDRAIDILKYLCDHDGKSTVAHLSNQLKINKVKTRYFFDVLDQRKLITVTIQPRYIEGKLTSEGRQYCADMGFLN